jgi:low affinity Fe/Cu permease
MGSASAAVVAVAVVGAWLLVGVVGGFSDRWLAVLYVITSVSTFVTVFFIQHTEDRDTRAILLKLDELVRAVSGARDDVIAVEDQPLHEQEQLEQEVREDARSGDGPPEPAGERRPAPAPPPASRPGRDSRG